MRGDRVNMDVVVHICQVGFRDAEWVHRMDSMRTLKESQKQALQGIALVL